MNQNIEKLYQIAKKPSRNIIGLMSGTSMDGLDIAYCRYRGSGPNTVVEVLAFETIPFEESVKDEIRKIFAKKNIDFQQLCVLNPWIGNLHGDLVNAFLKKNDIPHSDVDCIASHGQTVYHAPKILHKMPEYPNATLQIGDGDHLAMKTGILTVSDFRQKHCAAGGEGAPLAVYGDFLIFSKLGTDRVLLNMGGISNFTFLAADLDPNKVFATDTGPGNTMIDKLIQKETGKPYDENGEVAATGSVSEALLHALKTNDFFTAPVPKTTGPELFNLEYLENAKAVSNTKHLGLADTLATLCHFSAETIADTIKQALPNLMNAEVFFSGGGMYNPVLVNHIKKCLPNYAFYTTNDIGISGDAKEAILFATLANETLAGGKTNFGERGGVPSVSFGKVSFAE
jgi:anhydro-N-acetylmuramic acid kinase